MKRLLFFFLIAVFLLSISAALSGCLPSGPETSASPSGDPETGESGTSAGRSSNDPDGKSGAESGDETDENGSGTGESGQPDASDRKRRDGIVFTSEEQAEPIMDLALAEFQGLMRADKQTRYSDRIYAKYYNNYLLPYLEMLSSQQTVVEPGTVPSNWFPKGTDGIRSLIQSSYGNMYRKIAQDMLPYMLPDPDELLKSIAACCGGSSTVVDQRLDIDQMKQDYQKYADNWETMHYFDLLKSDWGTYWEDNLWAGTSYDFGNVWVGFCSPKYNRQKLVNLAVFGDKIEDDKREAFLPYSTANALLTEIQDARSKGGEFYIQNFTVTVKGTSEIASARLRDIFELFFPHASEGERSAWYAEMLSGETKHAFVYSVDHGFRFDKYINCYVENDYSFVMPSFGQYDGAQPRFGTEYRVDINDWYTNRTCDSYMKLGINTTHASQEEVYMTLKVEIGGKDILPTNLYRDADVFYCTNYQCNYGVFYPILAPFYYSEAVNSGCFTPYVISEPFAEDDIPIAPEYTAPKTEKTLADVIGDGTGEHGPTQETKWLSDGFGNDYHDFPPRNDPTSPQDLEKLGYKQNADGNWVRTLPTKDNEVSHTLIYDGDGVLRESERKYDTGTTRRSTYKTDVHNTPVVSLDRTYDSEGNMTDQSISRYDRDGAAYRRDYYETDLRSGEVNYFRTQSVIYDGEGEVCNRTFYRDNKRVSEYTVHTYESYTGTVGNPVIEYEKVVTETTFTESGAVDQVHKESVITTKEKEAATHAVQNYLEKVTGVKRDS